MYYTSAIKRVTAIMSGRTMASIKYNGKKHFTFYI
jgi:hypothetical protein